MVHPDSTFGSSECSEKDYIDEGVVFKEWDIDMDDKNKRYAPMLNGGSSGSTTSSSGAGGSPYYSP